MIHPTAIVDAGAQIAGDAEIGPYCVIGRDVVIGPGSVLTNHVTVAGPANDRASQPILSLSARLASARQDLKYARASRRSSRSAITTAFESSAR